MILISDKHKIVWPEVEIEVKDGLDVYPFYNDEMSAIIENLISIHVSNGRAIRRYMTTDKVVEFRNRRIL